jgi:diguanylate cyclase (GGDEF)-like protein
MPGALPDPGRALSRAGAGVSLAWALAGLAVCSAAVAGGIAWGLSAWFGSNGRLSASLAAAAAVLLGVCPMALVALKGASRLPLAPDPTQDFDASTGATTKALFMDLAEREWSRARRYGTGATLLLIDLDRTVRLTELFGPGVVDALLRELARQTSTTLRGADALARFGPTQLAIFLAQSDATGALDVAERIRERAEMLDVPPHASAHHRATVSVGVAQLRAAHLNLQSLIHDAEDAAVAARQAGGNCVRAAPVDLGRLLSPDPAPNDQRTRPQ